MSNSRRMPRNSTSRRNRAARAERVGVSQSERLRAAAGAIEGWTPAIVRKTRLPAVRDRRVRRRAARGGGAPARRAGRSSSCSSTRRSGCSIYLLSKKPEETLAPVRRHGLAQPLHVRDRAVARRDRLVLGVLARARRARRRRRSRRPPDAEVTGSGQLADFYVWQSFEQIPGLAINDTLQWDVPLQYGGGAGFVVLAFKVLILLPLVPVLLAACAPCPAARRDAGRRDGAVRRRLRRSRA